MAGAVRMTPRGLIGRALATGLIGAVLMAGAHFMTLSSGIALRYIGTGQGFPHTPGIPATAGGLALDCLIAALPVLPILALCWFAGPVLVSLGFLLLWYLGGDHLGLLFAAESGATYGWGDGFSLFYKAGPITFATAFVSLIVLWLLAPHRR